MQEDYCTISHYFLFRAARVLCMSVRMCVYECLRERVHGGVCVCVPCILIPLLVKRGCVHYRPVPALSL